MKCAHFLRIYNECMLCEHDCVKFHGHIAWHSFLENNFEEFLDEVRVKSKSRFRPVVGGILLEQHLLLTDSIIDISWIMQENLVHLLK